MVSCTAGAFVCSRGQLVSRSGRSRTSRVLPAVLRAAAFTAQRSVRTQRAIAVAARPGWFERIAAIAAVAITARLTGVWRCVNAALFACVVFAAIGGASREALASDGCAAMNAGGWNLNLTSQPSPTTLTGNFLAGDLPYLNAGGSDFLMQFSGVVGGTYTYFNLINTWLPVFTSGTLTLTVSGGSGDPYTVMSQMYCVPTAPVVTSISPAVGSYSTDTTVTITGTSFSGASAVLVPCSSLPPVPPYNNLCPAGASYSYSLPVTPISDTSMQVTLPAGGSGTFDLIVQTTTPLYYTMTAAANPFTDQFSYAPAPAISALSQSVGPFAGGNTVSITGSNFSGATAVQFGFNSATSFNVISPTLITATAPPGVIFPSPVYVTVTTPTGGPSSASAPGAAYTYVMPPHASQAIRSVVLTQSGAAAPFTPVTGSGGVAPLVYTASLPDGLSMNASTGTISGTPTVALAQTGITVYVTDAVNQTNQSGFLLTINTAVTATLSIPSVGLTLNKASTSPVPVSGGGGTGTRTYSISPSLPSGLSLNSATGAITGTPTASSATTNYTVTVTDQLNAAAANIFALTINGVVTATQSIATIALTQNNASPSPVPVTGGSGTPPLTYSVLPALPSGLTMNSSTGAVTGTPAVTSTATTYTVTVTDANGVTATNTFTLTVNPALTATQAVATVALTQNHAATSFTPVTGGGGTGALSYSVSPVLPAGLSMSSTTGAVTGTTAATVSAMSFTVTVTDTNNATATNTFSLKVNAAVTATQAVALTSLTQNHAATSFTPVTGGAGTTPLSYGVSPTLPAGLSMSSSTGAISGTPTATSAATGYTVTVTDANSATATNTFMLTVNSAVTATKSIGSVALTQNKATTSPIPVTGGGGTGPLSYGVSPSLPTGLSMNTSTGAITGTPAVTLATTFTVTVTDANSATASNTFMLTVNSAVTATVSLGSVTLAQGKATTSPVPVTGGGGTAPLSYGVSPSLPAVLSMSSASGAITGTPSAAGAAAAYTVTVTNSLGATASANFSLAVASALTLTATASSTTQLGQFYRQTNVAGGGTAPYTYSVSAGSVPPGTTLNTSTGVVFGTPTTAGSFNYTITVTDSTTPTAQTATQPVSGTIAPVTLTLVATPSATTQVGQAYSQSNTASGGTTPYMYSLASGTLAAGTTLNTSTGLVSGTPTTAGAFSYTIEVTDSTTPTAQTATQASSGTITQAASSTPTVTAVAPDSGPFGGGTSVTITGTNLTGATVVQFGGAAASSFTVNSATAITAMSPGGSGTVDITVTTPAGTSAANTTDRFTYKAATASLVQQGSKLIGSGAGAGAEQGYSVAMSADGNTALVAGFNDNAGTGAVWVFSQSAGGWTQVGGKLIGSGAVGAAQQGRSVALSADASTLIVGGSADNASVGAVWVFTQNGGVWSQQSAKLTASGESGAALFGSSLALSSNGGTAIIGGAADNGGAGAVWIFTRNGNSWAQQGSKLTPGDEAGAGSFGAAVALSSDGTSAVIGGPADNTGTGAVWSFSQSGGVWLQAAPKLVGIGNVGPAQQGIAVALSADGNTALVGGAGDSANSGAAWIFIKSGGAWSQAGSKLVGSGAAGAAEEGLAVALSGDASTAALGGAADKAGNGAVWVFSQSGGVWTQKGNKLVGSGNVGAAAQGSSVALSNNGKTLIEGGPLDNAGVGAAWVFIAPLIAATHDFNGDGYSDIAWRNSGGDFGIWLMNGTQILNNPDLGNVPTIWTVVGLRDFNGDGYADVLWRDTAGDVGMWFMNGAQILQQPVIGNVPTSWTVVGTGDFNGDGKGDILWRNSNGDIGIWLMNGTQILQESDYRQRA